MNATTACDARLFIADNYGDGAATIRCQLAPGHDGVHREQFNRKGGEVTITWVTDERKKCDHGCGRWSHDHHRDKDSACPKDAVDHEFCDCAYCNPGIEGKTCSACGKTYYYERGHLRRCAKGTGRPEDSVPCPACGNGPGVSCVGPRSHAARCEAYEARPSP